MKFNFSGAKALLSKMLAAAIPRIAAIPAQPTRGVIKVGPVMTGVRQPRRVKVKVRRCPRCTRRTRVVVKGNCPNCLGKRIASTKPAGLRYQVAAFNMFRFKRAGATT